MLPKQVARKSNSGLRAWEGWSLRILSAKIADQHSRYKINYIL